MPFDFSNFDISPPRIQLPDYSAQLAEISESIEAGKEDMIRRQAEANAEAYPGHNRSSYLHLRMNCSGDCRRGMKAHQLSHQTGMGMF